MWSIGVRVGDGPKYEEESGCRKKGIVRLISQDTCDAEQTALNGCTGFK